MKFKWSKEDNNYKEEMIATAMVLIVAVTGSFFVLDKMVNGDDREGIDEVPQVIVSPAETLQDSTVLGESDEGNKKSAIPSITPGASPTANPFESEISYGVGGTYEFDEYKMEILNPRIQFDSRKVESRKFLIEVKLRNIMSEGGMPNQIKAEIVKDGSVIVPSAAMSVSEVMLLKPGEVGEFTAKLSLIDGTDVRKIMFKVDESTPELVHEFIP